MATLNLALVLPARRRKTVLALNQLLWNQSAILMEIELTTRVEELPWPAAGDILFKEGNGGWFETARVDSRCLETLRTGFASAARVLTDYLVNGKGHEAIPDILFFPIAYNYRQAVELGLKQIVIQGNALYTESESCWGHNLRTLWRSVRGILERFYPDDTINLDNVEATLFQLADVDPNSDGFRYPSDGDGQPTLSKLVVPVDITNFSQKMEGILSFLYGSSCEIGEYYSNSSDC